MALEKAVVYQAADGAIELRGDKGGKTLWATQVQMAAIFRVKTQAVSRHLTNIYAEGELERGATSSILELVQIENGRSVRRKVEVFDLDAVISVGYRISSKAGTHFRKWATKTLRTHVVEGFTLNRKRVIKNHAAFMRAVESVRALVPAGSLVDTGSVLTLISSFAETWFSLAAYDEGRFAEKTTTKRSVTLAGSELSEGITQLKVELVRKGEATELFATEKSAGSIAGIVGNVVQSFGGKDVYPSIEEKAAHLLYFMVKNHLFLDGNKRSGAFAFAWFLQRAGILDAKRLTPSALTALTLLIAESDPKNKEQMTGLVMLLLGK